MTAPTLSIPLTAPVNLRDLGGIPAAAGPVRPGFALRADDLSTVDPDTAAGLVSEGLTTVIDLRTPAEVRLTGRGPLAAQPVTYHHVPFLASVDEGQEDGETLTHQPSFERMYIRMYEQAAPRIVQALAIVAASPGATAFHCAAGQDRTGVLAASLLLALGAEPEAIITDYARTGGNSARIRERIAPVMEPLLASTGIRMEDAAKAAMRAEFSPAPMAGLLSHLTRTHTDPLAPLRAAGLTDGLVSTLRERAHA
ncbi:MULTISPECIES: tyrosine-protein phosphatase [Brevibacterium]|uniref:Tyrosine-protein phosphatase n=1 Tax=Brevibacterium salitolerans TaxID=1403566 RepID=A0ABN2WCI0_9MICO|nr:tyrosine-protein phosphatase [Brevibacterium sp.]